ncbi:MAG: beta-lactamase family protein [Kordiimonadaceae bacterium]|nr:beta-lactamase family protein [Kordiimonadaceae bacterium]MBT6034910.1 beta-lactamase family protein [Kordiimonadaceae bacterium]MBT6330928.1 beta-lactamase family protein [Kordiimonadaceae bacterium]MBT7582783.1 beta-lactamase family protein [Kordiimonadaceae bacterium]
MTALSRIKIKSITFILLSFSFISLANAQTNQGMSLERLSRIDGVMQGYIDDEKLSGNVIYIQRNGKPVYYKAFGKRDVEADAPMNRNAMFRIASQTKAITSVGIMILQEQGKLLIGDKVGKYLPEFMETTVAQDDGNGGYTVVPASRSITIRDLLTHTAGIDYGLGTGADAWKEAGIQGWYFGDRDEPIRETVRRIADLPNAAQPGTKFVYGYNTDILGALIEVVSGKPLDEFLTENIFNPLHMHDTYFYVPEDKADRVATVYSLKGDKISLAGNPGQLEGGSHVGQGHYINGPRKGFAGGAGLVSTASNYGTFLQMVANGGTLNGTRILSPKTVEHMTQNHLDGIDFRPGLGFGLGFEIVTDLGEYGVPGSKGAYGWGGAYHSVYWIDPTENMVVVYMTQLIPAGGLDDQKKLRALIYQAIVE